MSLRHITLIVLLATASGVWGAEAEDVAPPERVARLSYLSGEVSLQAVDGQAPEPADLNRPLASGDRIFTDADSRAEVSTDIATIRLNEQTDLSVDNLTPDAVRFELNSGTVSVHVRQLSEGETIELSTPGATARLLEPGEYRVDIAPDGSIAFAVYEGAAEVNDESNRFFRLDEAQQLSIAAGQSLANVGAAPPRDAFDDWARDRERQLASSESRRYVTRDVVGYEDLDRYGTWYSEPEYGYVWSPHRISPGWEPYRYGRWTYISSWGWTWIDNEPWGFAPFHYGSWVFLKQRWCWVPGPRHHWSHRHFGSRPPVFSWRHKDDRGFHADWRFRDDRHFRDGRHYRDGRHFRGDRGFHDRSSTDRRWTVPRTPDRWSRQDGRVGGTPRSGVEHRVEPSQRARLRDDVQRHMRSWRSDRPSDSRPSSPAVSTRPPTMVGARPPTVRSAPPTMTRPSPPAARPSGSASPSRSIRTERGAQRGLMRPASPYRQR